MTDHGYPRRVGDINTTEHRTPPAESQVEQAEAPKTAAGIGELNRGCTSDPVAPDRG